MKLRDWQEDLLPKVVSGLRSRKLVALSAPTGSGKTLLVLSASLELGLPVSVFVRSKSQFQPWLRDAAKVAGERRVTLLIGQGESCRLSGGELSSPAPCDVCKVNRPLQADPPAAASVPGPTEFVRSLHRAAARADACPYRTMLAWSSDAWLLVASYPYLTSPLARKSIEDRLSRSLVVVDEAHNLDSAAEEHVLTGRMLDGARRQSRSPESKAIIGALADLVSESQDWREVDKPLELAGHADRLKDESSELYANMARGERVHDNYLQLVSDFLSALPEVRFKLYAGYGGLRLIDPDPAPVLSVLSSPPAVILMSATLPPAQYVQRVWGIERDVVYLDARPGWGRRIEVMPPPRGLTTKYERRGGDMWSRYAEALEDIWESAGGSVLAVFPSYSVMEEVASRLGSLPIFVEDRRARADTLEEELRRGRRLVLAVARGKLVEGVEFRDVEGSSLISDVVLVGVPYRQPDAVEEERTRRISSRAGLGESERWRLLQLLPAWQAVAQAVGRAVRGESDHARVWPLDERYANAWWMARLESISNY
ncbi:MAG: helicase C-terminal domain-containing protein [Conexivisphaera sp.]|jgi:DNA excision repair protein ERCC-2|nr:ATP-dependent DNA helicase [Conexivisphaerales archaeon]